MPDQPPDDPLEELRAQIRATQEAAERLAAEAAGARAEWEAGQQPREGWSTASQQQERSDELRSLVALLQSFGELMPPELVEQFRELLRQLLLLLRAIIDWWVRRIDGVLVGPARAPDSGPPTVEDIPVG